MISSETEIPVVGVPPAKGLSLTAVTGPVTLRGTKAFDDLFEATAKLDPK